MRILSDYRCNHCDTDIELLADRDKTIKCDTCKKPMIKQVAACRQFVFKGDGTYTKGAIGHGKP